MSKPSAADHLTVRRLVQALKRFQPGQGAISRRSARRSVGARLAALRAALDKDFPLLNEKRGPRREGMKLTNVTSYFNLAKRAGYHPRTGKPAGYYIASWLITNVVLLDAATTSELREARKSTTARAALLAKLRLFEATL